MAVLSVHKVTALPGSLAANTVYVVAPPSNPNFVEIYVTSTSAEAKRVIDEERVAEMIAAAVAGVENLLYAADITARDALVLTANAKVYVADASADSTVTSGGATYFYNHAEEEFIKTSEEESMDIALNWAALADKPSSSVADIDDAVSKKHAHTNMTQLNKIGESGGNLTYDGNLPSTGWASTAW